MSPLACIKATSCCRSPVRAVARMRARAASTAAGRRAKSVANSPPAPLGAAGAGGSPGRMPAPVSAAGGTNWLALGGVTAAMGGRIVSVRTLTCATAPGPPASVAMAKIEAIKARMRISGQLSGIRYQNRAGSAPAPLITDC